MLNLRRNFVIPLLVWQALVAGSIVIMDLATGGISLGPEARRFWTFAFLLGFVVVLLTWPVCRMFRRVTGALAGLGLGLLIPVLYGWIWGLLVDHYWQTSWGHSWTFLEAWIEGWVLSIPSGIAGVFVGFLQAKRATRAPSDEGSVNH
jgi:hypothetical protein